MKIYNSMTGKKEEFKPVMPGKVKMYSCGPTVYNYFHIGNARAFLFFDAVRKYLTYAGYEVTYVQNLTDIDDKLIQKSIEEGLSVKKTASKYIDAFYEDTAALGIDKPDFQPKATDYIGKMIKYIKVLVDRNFAYESNGDVYFSVESFKNYGVLSGRKLKDLKAGARIEENKQKRNPFDFTLWKKAKENEPSWGSPWGEGRPGWHTECVVMSQDLLGEVFDIHGGGTDLIFPHHENENAQAEVITGKHLANIWMHNGFLNIGGEKMSKSFNNFFTARDILKKYSSEAVRFFFLSKHYRSPIDFNESLMKEAESAVKNFYNAFEDISLLDFIDENIDMNERTKKFEKEFHLAMQDDFNTAKALAVMFDLLKEVKNKNIPHEDRKNSSLFLLKIGRSLGFFAQIKEKLQPDFNSKEKELIELFIEYRKNAKKNKDYILADKIRNDLYLAGIELRDSPSGTEWRIIK
ncbi:MAG: cysteine--tRNA ligase [Candidatus Cloacimonadota bacterium]|nr:MAG: cysteine--tRNA ligase [Candidatus Cloacimonadota bacterium]